MKIDGFNVKITLNKDIIVTGTNAVSIINGGEIAGGSRLTIQNGEFMCGAGSSFGFSAKELRPESNVVATIKFDATKNFAVTTLLTNKGIVNWESGDISYKNIENSGTWNFRAADLHLKIIGNNSQFVNTGRINADIGAGGESHLSGTFVNRGGELWVNSGLLQLYGPSLQESGVTRISSLATLGTLGSREMVPGGALLG